MSAKQIEEYVCPASVQLLDLGGLPEDVVKERHPDAFVVRANFFLSHFCCHFFLLHFHISSSKFIKHIINSFVVITFHNTKRKNHFYKQNKTHNICKAKYWNCMGFVVTVNFGVVSSISLSIVLSGK